MSTKLTYTGAEVQELLDKIEKGDFGNAKTLEGHTASYFAIASEFTDFKSLFNSMFEKDSGGNIHAKLSLWSSGGITAGGVGSGGSGGGSGISYSRLDSWADYSADKAGYVLSAALGYDINTRLTSVENAGYVTASALAPYVLRSEVEGQYLSKNGGTVNGSITATSFIGNLTGTADNASLLSNRRLNLYGNPFGAIPYVGADGVMEVGQYIDFHAIGEAESDYSLRLECIGAYGNWITLPTKSGVLALTSDVLSVNGGTVNGLVQAPFFSASEWMSARFFTSDIFPVSANTTGMCRWGTFDEVGGLKIQFGADSDTNIEVVNREWNAALFRIDTSGKVWAADTITAPSFIGNLTGTADKASTQAVPYSSRDVNLWDIGNRTARYFALSDTAQNTPSGVSALGSILMEYSWDTNAGAQLLSHNRGNNIFYRSRWNGAFKDWREIAFTDSNVASATKLATPRTIWGQSFDGTQDITGALTAPVINTNTLKVGNVTLVEENGALKVIGGFIATGGVTSGEKTS